VVGAGEIITLIQTCLIRNPIGWERLSGQEKYRLKQGVYGILYSRHEEEITMLDH
jgi:hypothetical protein